MGFNATNPEDAELDPDNDGLNNHLEFTIKTSPILFDTDKDGMDDGYEYQMGLNPLVPDGHLDYDGDLVKNLDEYYARTDPFNLIYFPILSINLIYIIVLVISLTIIAVLTLIWVMLRIIKYKKKIQAPTLLTTFLVWKNSFINYKEFHLAKLKGASTRQEFKLVQKYLAPNYTIAVEIYQGKFINYNQYLEAKALGASTLKESDLIRKYNAPDYEIAFCIDQGGFPSHELYEIATQERYFTFEDYLNK